MTEEQKNALIVKFAEVERKESLGLALFYGFFSVTVAAFLVFWAVPASDNVVTFIPLMVIVMACTSQWRNYYNAYRFHGEVIKMYDKKNNIK